MTITRAHNSAQPLRHEPFLAHEIPRAPKGPWTSKPILLSVRRCQQTGTMSVRTVPNLIGTFSFFLLSTQYRVAELSSDAPPPGQRLVIPKATGVARCPADCETTLTRVAVELNRHAEDVQLR